MPTSDMGDVDRMLFNKDNVHSLEQMHNLKEETMGRVAGDDRELRNYGQDISGSLRIRRQKPLLNVKFSEGEKGVGGLSPDSFPGVRGPWASGLGLKQVSLVCHQDPAGNMFGKAQYMSLTF